MLNFTWLSDEDDAVLRAISSRDWRSEALTLGDPADEELAAKAVALGALACTPFATVYAIVARADPMVLRHLQQLIGADPEQAGSITTLRKQLPSVFDWSNLDRARTLANVDRLLECGPLTLRGPAAPQLGSEVVEVVVPYKQGPSTRFIRRCLAATGDTYLHVGFARPAAYERLGDMQREFGGSPGVVMLRARDFPRQALRRALVNPLTPLDVRDLQRLRVA